MRYSRVFVKYAFSFAKKYEAYYSHSTHVNSYYSHNLTIRKALIFRPLIIIVLVILVLETEEIRVEIPANEQPSFDKVTNKSKQVTFSPIYVPTFC